MSPKCECRVILWLSPVCDGTTQLTVQEEYRKDMGHNKLIHDKKEEVLMHRWRYPSLSLHGK